MLGEVDCHQKRKVAGCLFFPTDRLFARTLATQCEYHLRIANVLSGCLLLSDILNRLPLRIIFLLRRLNIQVFSIAIAQSRVRKRHESSQRLRRIKRTTRFAVRQSILQTGC